MGKIERELTVVLLAITAWMVAGAAIASSTSAAEFTVNPKVATAGDENPGTADKPLKTVAKALELAKSGDTILLGAADYPAVTISKTYEKPLTLGAAKGARPVMTGGVSIRKAGGIRLSGLTFTWPAGGRPAAGMTTFLAILDSKDVEVADCELFDDAKLAEWVGWACNCSNSERVTVHDCKAHHFYYGFSAYQSKDVIFRNLDIGPWTHEDGIRITECEGPVLAENCRICNTAAGHKTTGHVDGIQVDHWTDNLTIRNCYIHGLGQGLSAFGLGQAISASGGKSPITRRRKNFRIEGNVVYDVYAPHACTICETDSVTVINNTFPQDQLKLLNCTGIVARNNIVGRPVTGKYQPTGFDYNLWITGDTKLGEHDLVNVDPKFVNAPVLSFRTEYARLKEMTRSKFFAREVKGKIAVGDTVEVFNSDGAARDAIARHVTAIGDDWLEVDPPLAADPDWAGVIIYKWPAGQKNLAADYHLKADSPAIGSADSSVQRGRDMDGHGPAEAASASKTAAADVKLLDRGAFEFVPASPHGLSK